MAKGLGLYVSGLGFRSSVSGLGFRFSIEECKLSAGIPDATIRSTSSTRYQHGTSRPDCNGST